MLETEKHGSSWDYPVFYTISIFLGLFGGVISYIILRRDRSDLAKGCLITGVFSTIIWWIIVDIIISRFFMR